MTVGIGKEHNLRMAMAPSELLALIKKLTGFLGFWPMAQFRSLIVITEFVFFTGATIPRASTQPIYFWERKKIMR